ncbi:MAG TPA: ABC-2 transporter permease [Steroidobacteraceae bacterium]|nr:ABC-2 transporter permease [Steroidobacteraceae bacterium]
MNRFLWLVRREVWEHKAIWVAPAIVIGCLALLVMTGNAHLGPLGDAGESHIFGDVPRETQLRVLAIVYAGLALVVFMVMGIVAFFYSIDSLYADRRDRSVLFWKSLPLSDLETVLSKFATAIIVIPLVALAASAVAQLIVAAGGSARLAMNGLPGGLLWEPQALLGGFMAAFLWCLTAMLWYSPIVGYLMLASAWAPRGPFLWAVLPPVGLWILERMVVGSEYVGDFITDRLFGLYRLLGEQSGGEVNRPGGDLEKIGSVDLVGSLRDFYASPELWLGVAAAFLLLAGAMWVRRYRDETS